MRAPLPPLDTPGLFPSEKRIITMAATMSDAEIAVHLGITVNTVRMTLLNARNKKKDADDKIRLANTDTKGAPDIRHRSVL